MQKIIRPVYKVVYMKMSTVALSIMLKSQKQPKRSTKKIMAYPYNVFLDSSSENTD